MWWEGRGWAGGAGLGGRASDTSNKVVLVVGVTATLAEFLLSFTVLFLVTLSLLCRLYSEVPSTGKHDNRYLGKHEGRGAPGWH